MTPLASAAAIAALDAVAVEDARARLTRCCGAGRWVDALLAARPFRDEAGLRRAVDRAFDGMERRDWLEAFAHHPKIGDLDSLRQKFASTQQLTTKEQAGVADAADTTLQALADGNRAYEARHGFIFIVCATGKSAGEMLALLRARLERSTEAELAAAAGEQRKITTLRLGSLSP